MKMISIKNILQVTIGVVLALSLPRCNSPESKVKLKVEPTAAAGWENLSDPEHIAWHTYGRNGLGKAWKMEDSVIHLDAAIKEGWQTKDGGDIVTNNEYENFDLKLQWKISEGGNSGIMFYVKEDTAKYKYPWESGPEMQVADNEKNEDGKVVKSRAGDLYELMSISKDVVKPAGQWNDVEIIADHGSLNFIINGEHVLSTTMWNEQWKKMIMGTKFSSMPGFGSFRKGKIGLQDHGADVWYKDVKIKTMMLNAKS